MTIEQEILEFANSQWGEKTWEGLGLKLGEEAGEVAGALVKIPEGRATNEDLDLEVGDTLVVLSQIAARRGTTLQSLLIRRFIQIKERASKRGCAACDRGVFQLGHRDGCPGIAEDEGNLTPPPVNRLVRIKIGATVYRDHASRTWPDLHNVEDPDMIFKVVGEDHQGWLRLEAPKFGEKGNYGNGLASVQAFNCVDVEASVTEQLPIGACSQPAESWAEVPPLIDARPAEYETVSYGISRAIQGNEVIVDCRPELGGIDMAKLTFSDRDTAWAAYCRGLRISIKVVAHPEHELNSAP